MWDKEFRDYKRDQPLIKERIETGKNFSGCEMHELNGWGNTLQHPKKKKRGFIASLLIYLFTPKKDKHR
jgi:hypothetical protein